MNPQFSEWPDKSLGNVGVATRSGGRSASNVVVVNADAKKVA